MGWKKKKHYALYTHHIVLIRLVFTTALQKDKSNPGFKECVNLRLLSDISGTIGMKMDRSLVSITKTPTKKSRAVVRSMKFLSPEVAHYPYTVVISGLVLLVAT